ncbi:MAG: YjjG family noncanonical pyrimidine nucleotidase [Corallococcus sp.]|nr:YjjG family noncanonical pyrimidine nucleotidase [Corallococcus sp.]MCM1359450.1 YjjG family noncanonical pyrimidine nucleotidase [Corallococcus sp.]MCM1394738.1 YjjG family noncanonical pyrimidine nucleotidase [Corallococcus sp.]
MKYEVLLFDADNTVLDFDKSEEQALKAAFVCNGLPYDASILQIYRNNNIAQWQRYERGEISRDEVLLNRFTDTFAQLGVSADIMSVAELYEKRLHSGFFVVPYAEDVLAVLQSSGYRLYIVSNGVLTIQNSRMAGSGLDKYFIKRFISEEIGYPKPHVEFFNRSFAQIDGLDKSKTLIIGDSLSGDIQGGINAQIDTCWFNPNNMENTFGIAPTYEIRDLREIFDIVK